MISTPNTTIGCVRAVGCCAGRRISEAFLPQSERKLLISRICARFFPEDTRLGDGPQKECAALCRLVPAYAACARPQARLNPGCIAGCQRDWRLLNSSAGKV